MREVDLSVATIGNVNGLSGVIALPGAPPWAMCLRPVLAAVAAALCTGAWAQTADTEDWSARYQSTYNAQRHPAFRSRYDGPNSLGASPDRMHTFSATAHWGTRLWKGGELYFNPELAAGVPFSRNLIGLGGFTNGEITRAAGSEPKPYIQRLFVRQTWNQGGGSEKLHADFNQMAATVDRHRVVLTAGNFSTLDVFDDNAYAKDPRTQFMNWGNWTYAAFDYAADARGFGWGAALEWYRGDWVLRAGRMTSPRVPNGLQLDFALGRHYGDQIEVGAARLEAIHLVGHTPGSIALLYDDPDGPPHLFTGDCLFPGGVGKTFGPENFTSLLDDVTRELFARFDDDTVVWPGHGAPTTLGVERPHLDEWKTRGW